MPGVYIATPFLISSVKSRQPAEMSTVLIWQKELNSINSRIVREFMVLRWIQDNFEGSGYSAVKLTSTVNQL